VLLLDLVNVRIRLLELVNVRIRLCLVFRISHLVCLAEDQERVQIGFLKFNQEVSPVLHFLAKL